MVAIDGRRVVFVDTPGHEAFTRMRARGAKVTDIVVLVVAADDGVMPQTHGSHRSRAEPRACRSSSPSTRSTSRKRNPNASSGNSPTAGLMPEEWGGDTVMVEVSAKQKKNLDKLLEMILLVADLRDLRANPDAPASGTVLESRVDKGRGPVATCWCRTGRCNTGDVFICGSVYRQSARDV